MLDSIYHMTLKLIKNHIFGVKTSRFCHLLCNIKMNVIIYKPLVVYCIVLYHSQRRPHVIKYILFSIKHKIMFIAYTNNLHINLVNNNNNFLEKLLAFFYTPFCL